METKLACHAARIRNRKHALSGLLRLGTMPAEMATLVNARFGNTENRY
ncbi:MAG: hypothetical protein ACQEXV_17180 [Bacillota bacterium]